MYQEDYNMQCVLKFLIVLSFGLQIVCLHFLLYMWQIIYR